MRKAGCVCAESRLLVCVLGVASCRAIEVPVVVRDTAAASCITRGDLKKEKLRELLPVRQAKACMYLPKSRTT